MAAPAYTPASGAGTVSGGYKFNGSSWEPVSSGSNNSSGSNMQIGGWYNNPAAGGANQRYWGNGTWTTGSDPTSGGSNNNNNNGGNSGVSSSDPSTEINPVYQSMIDELGRQGTEYSTSADTQKANTEKDWTEGNTNINNENADLLSNIALQEEKTNKGAQSGYSEALRAFNALKQQGASKYGQGSSVGQAIGELTGQQFLRTTGEARGQVTDALNQLGLEKTKVGTYIAGKKSELDKWKRDAIQQINDNLATRLAEINMRKLDVEANKTADRKQALADAMTKAEQIKSEDNTFKQNLASYAVQALASNTNRTLTPKEIADTVNGIMSQTFKGFTGTTIG
jgi:hypothetical protein